LAPELKKHHFSSKSIYWPGAIRTFTCYNSEQKLGVNPTIAGYNASVVNFYNATGSLARFENKKYFILF
jgi:hypothetical protein